MASPPVEPAMSIGPLPMRRRIARWAAFGITVTGAGTTGYWLAGSDGAVYTFGHLGFFGSLPGLGIHVNNVVGMANT